MRNLEWPREAAHADRLVMMRMWIPSLLAACCSISGLATAQDAGLIADPPVEFRQPLFREGSSLVGAVGRIERDHRRKAWVFIIEPDQPDEPPHRLLLLPCTRLEQMQQLAASMIDEPVQFEMTGRVFVYRGENYLLPTLTPQVRVAPVEPVRPARDESRRESGGDLSAEDMMADLESSIGPVARSTQTGEPMITRRADLTPEGTAITLRRGQLARDRDGAWIFVFDADAQGLADPPMVVLPCMLLEQMTKHAQNTGRNATLLVSGEVMIFENENYLLPSIFQVPVDRTRLTP